MKKFLILVLMTTSLYSSYEISKILTPDTIFPAHFEGDIDTVIRELSDILQGTSDRWNGDPKYLNAIEFGRIKNLTTNKARELWAVFKQFNCTKLRIEYMKNDELVMFFSELQGLPKLQSITLYECAIDQTGAATLDAAFARVQGLEALRLISTFNSQGLQVIVPVLSKLTGLKELTINQNKLTSNSGSILAQALAKLTALKYLELNSNGNLQGWDDISSALSKCTELQVLEVGEVNLSANRMKALAPGLAKLTKLKNLILARCMVDNEGAMILAQLLPNFSGLQLLNCAGNNISSKGIEALAPALMQYNQGLKELRLSGNSLGEEGAVALAPALSKLPELLILGLVNNNIGLGIAALAKELEGMTQLQSLELGSNGIGTKGMEFLAPALAKLTNLIAIDITGNDLDQSAFKYLASAMKGMKSLKKIRLVWGNEASNEDMDLMRNTLWEAGLTRVEMR